MGGPLPPSELAIAILYAYLAFLPVAAVYLAWLARLLVREARI